MTRLRWPRSLSSGSSSSPRRVRVLRRGADRIRRGVVPSDGVTVSDLEYEDTLHRAEAAGHTVEHVGSGGFHPEGIDVPDAFLGLPDGDNIGKQVVRVSTVNEE